MISNETLLALKISFLVLAVTAMIIKVVRIIKFNNKKEELIDMNLLGRFSSMEIDGSYNAERKRVLASCNRLTFLFYLFVVLYVLASIAPKVAKGMGFL
jgi:hypothetical protein